MSDKQTSCPTCSTAYKVTVAQLTVAQGMVCCPKCSTSFNALMHLTKPNAELNENNTHHLNTPSTQTNNNTTELPYNYSNTDFRQPLEIFNRKVENSNIDLKTYLNNLNYFSADPIGQLPAVNWNESSEPAKKRSLLYYVGWVTINLSFILLLTFQFFWFNPEYIKHSSIMNSSFNILCEKISCTHVAEHYDSIITKKVKTKSTYNSLNFTGELVNQHERSLPTPRLQVELKKNGYVIATHVLTPDQYLVESFVGIQRIPKNSPFKFAFTIPASKRDFDDYQIQAIRP